MTSEYATDDPAAAEAAAAKERKAEEDQAFADKLAKRLPPDAVEHGERAQQTDDEDHRGDQHLDERESRLFGEPEAPVCAHTPLSRQRPPALEDGGATRR